jgi:hypothetical protein
MYPLNAGHRIASGGVAQLGARLNGIQEVRGSIPLVSTRNDDAFEKSKAFFACTYLAVRTRPFDGNLAEDEEE